MQLDELKKAVSARTGVPAHLLTGETEEELEARARALVAFARDKGVTVQPAPATPKSTAEQFAEWIDAQFAAQQEDIFSDPDSWERIFE